MVFFVISILLFCVDFAFSDELCQTKNDPCKCVLANNSVIDLSSIGHKDHPWFYEVQLSTNCTDLFSYNPCFPFDSPDKGAVTEPDHTPCIGASACVKGIGGTNGTAPKEYALGLQNTTIFGQDKIGLYINYTTPKSKEILQVYLKCRNDSAVPDLSMNKPHCLKENPNIVLTLTTKCACADGCKPGGPTDTPESSSFTPTDPTNSSSVAPSDTPSTSSHGLSTGSKLLIAFFTILLAYLLIGIVWNFCNGVHGVELIPNIEFWKDLPTLMMEGVAFACSCCGRKSSYGEV